MIRISWPLLGQTRLLLMIGVALLIANNELLEIRGENQAQDPHKTTSATGKLKNAESIHRFHDNQKCNNQQHHREVLKIVPLFEIIPSHITKSSTIQKENFSANQADWSGQKLAPTQTPEQLQVKSCCLTSNLSESRSRIEIEMTTTEVAPTSATKETRLMIKQQGSHYHEKPAKSTVERLNELNNLVRLERNRQYENNKAENQVAIVAVAATNPIEESQRRRIRRSTGKSSASLSSQSSVASVPSSQASNAIQALVGQRLSIPCSNLTLGTSEQQHQHLARPSGAIIGANRRQPTTGNLANGQGISLIVWHKDDQLDLPIFTIDARGSSSLREAKQQTGSEQLKGRAHFEESTRVDSRGFGSTPALVIDEAGLQDGGLYTCTVEFYKAPTQMHQIRVNLISPPKNMVIVEDLNDNQRLISNSASGFVSSLAGPYDEDTSLALTCEAEFGERSSGAQIGWWQLSSVSVLPANDFVASSAKLPPAKQVDFANAEYMTTVSLVRSIEDESSGSSRTSISSASRLTPTAAKDYFVGLHSNPHEQNQVIPFADGQQLKHWTRVKNEQLQNSRTDKLQVSFQLTLARSHLDNEFLCLAANNDLSVPLNSSVRINLNLKPTEVRIVRKSEYLFKLGQKLVVECQVYGSKPAPTVRWFRGSKPLAAGTLQESPSAQDDDKALSNYISEFNRDINNNLTKISYLALVPQLSDNQKSLVCSAHNPRISSSNMEPLSDSIIMNVQFPAQLTLHYGTNIRQDSIKLGSDVFMDCNIQANPPIIELIWLFNDEPLAANVSNGVIISNQSLALQRVRLENRGHYQCAARNAMGYSRSNKLELKPKFKPICDHTHTKTRYEVTINQSIKIDCNVVAEPSDGLEFVWKFNQTLGSDSEVSYHTEKVEHYETNFTRSQVTFTPKTKRHYGSFLCSAINSIGTQEKPCVIQVALSESPDPVFGCFFDNLSNSSFSVHCQTSPSLSSRQNYLLELYTNDSIDNLEQQSAQSSTNESVVTHLRQRQESLPDLVPDEEQPLISQQQRQQQSVRRVRSETPSFDLTDLKPDTIYNLMIYVINSKGRSLPAYYQTNTLPASANQGALSSGQVQFINKRPNASSSLSFTEKLNSYFKSGSDYLNTSNLKPLTSVLLIALLFMISVTILTLFVTRVCRRRRNGVDGSRKRNEKARGSLKGQVERITNEKLSVYRGREPLLDRSVQLTPASKARIMGLAGNGSDTSRETNTDSTLISDGCARQHALLDNKQQQSDKIKPTIESHYQTGAIQEGLSSNGLPSTLPIMMLAHGNTLKGKSDEQARNMQTLYTQVIKRSNNNINNNHNNNINNSASNQIDAHELSNTPQVSIRSGSDCTSNNELQADQSEFHDQLLVKCHDNMSEPVYVISRNRMTTNGRVGGGEQSQLHLLNPSELWPYSEPVGIHNGGSISGGTQVSSIGTGDSVGDQRTITANSVTENVCQLVGDMQSNPNEMPIPVGFLPSSISIPVSLSDCLHFGRAALDQPHRHLSEQEFLAPAREALCIANSNGSYLTLAPNSNEIRYSQSPYSLCCDERMQQNQALSIEPSEQQTSASSPFANRYQHHCGLQDIDTNKYHCSQTLDNPNKRYRQSIDLRERLLQRDRRGSCNERIGNQHQQKNHVKFNPQSESPYR